jgi:hypothetical protein
LIETTAMIGSPASRGANASVARAGRACWAGGLFRGAAAVGAVSAAVTASVIPATDAHLIASAGTRTPVARRRVNRAFVN